MIISLPNGFKANIGEDLTRFCTCHEVFYLQNYGGLSLHRGDTVLDCGANIGLFTLYVAKRVARVFSVEPLSENYRLFWKNMKTNGLFSEVTGLHMAVCDRNGEGFMVGHGGGGRLVKNCFSDSEKVRCVTVDYLEKLLHSEFDVIKIDVEGSEVQVLKGAEKSLPHVREIAIEVHSDLLGKECQRILEANGFRVSAQRPRRDFKWFRGYALMNLRQLMHHHKPLIFKTLCKSIATDQNPPSQLNIIHGTRSRLF